MNLICYASAEEHMKRATSSLDYIYKAIGLKLTV